MNYRKALAARKAASAALTNAKELVKGARGAARVLLEEQREQAEAKLRAAENDIAYAIQDLAG